MDSIAELSPGLYKVKAGKNLSRLRITIQNGAKLYKLGKTVTQPISHFDPDFERITVLRKIEEAEPVLDAELVLRWKDQDGTQYELSAKTSPEFRAILDDNPDVFAKVQRRKRR